MNFTTVRGRSGLVRGALEWSKVMEQPLDTSLEARIREVYADLSAAERKLADVVLARQHDLRGYRPPNWRRWRIPRNRARRGSSGAWATRASTSSAWSCAAGRRCIRRSRA